MSREAIPHIRMNRSAHYVTQQSLWAGPQFTSRRKHKQNRYSRPRAPKVDEKALKLRDLILNALLA